MYNEVLMEETPLLQIIAVTRTENLESPSFEKLICE